MRDKKMRHIGCLKGEVIVDALLVKPNSWSGVDWVVLLRRNSSIFHNRL